MAIRIPFPDDVCTDPDAKYYRTLAEAFPCDAYQAVAMQQFTARRHPGRWLTVVLTVLFSVAMADCSSA